MVFAGQTIPFVLMPHFVSPGQVRRVKHAVTVAVPGARPLLRRLPDRPGAARRAPAPRHRGLADPHRPGLPAPDAHLPARRLPAGLRRQVPRVQRRLARRRRLHRHPLRGPAHDDRPPARAPGVRHRLHADPARADHDARATPTRTCAPPAPTCRRRRGSRSSTPRARRASPSSASSAPPPRPPASRPTTPRSTRSPTTARTLHVKDEPVQLVYRRALLEDLDQSDLVAAARDGRVCLVNPFRSRVANNKKLFALFQDPRFAHLIDGDEADVIKATIPWTRILRPGRVTYGDWTHRPALVRRRQPREAGAQAGLRLRRPRRLARHGDARRTSGSGSSPRTPTARTTSCRSTSRYRRRCSRRSRTGTSRCA